MKVLVEKCRETAKLPEYAKLNDAGMDVFAAQDLILKAGETGIVPTGIKLAIPQGYEIQVRPRSGISLNTPLRIVNSPGTVDSGYRDELGIIIGNSSSHESEIPFNISEKGNKQGTYLIKTGDRIAQIVLNKVYKIEFTLIDSVESEGFNRGGGFGSTGVK